MACINTNEIKALISFGNEFCQLGKGKAFSNFYLSRGFNSGDVGLKTLSECSKFHPLMFDPALKAVDGHDG